MGNRFLQTLSLQTDINRNFHIDQLAFAAVRRIDLALYSLALEFSEANVNTILFTRSAVRLCCRSHVRVFRFQVFLSGLLESLCCLVVLLLALRRVVAAAPGSVDLVMSIGIDAADWVVPHVVVQV